jgi:hypothetical protein
VRTLVQDIVAMVYNADRLSWYENSGANSNKSSLFDWSGAEHQIDVRLSGVRDLVLEDLNRDGHLDLAKVWLAHGGALALWYLSVGPWSCVQASYIDNRIAYYLSSVTPVTQPSGAVKNIVTFSPSQTVTYNARRAQTVRAVDVVRSLLHFLALCPMVGSDGGVFVPLRMAMVTWIWSAPASTTTPWHGETSSLCCARCATTLRCRGVTNRGVHQVREQLYEHCTWRTVLDVGTTVQPGRLVSTYHIRGRPERLQARGMIAISRGACGCAVVSDTCAVSMRWQCADMDGNGRVDVVSISNAAGAVYWHEQVSPTQWVQRTISTNAFGVESVAIGDLVRQSWTAVGVCSCECDLYLSSRCAAGQRRRQRRCGHSRQHGHRVV